MKESVKETFLKFYDFAVLCVSILAAIGGTAYLFYDKHYLFGATNIILVAMACPFIVKRAKDLLS